MKERTKNALFEFLRALVAALAGLCSALLVESCGTTTRAVVTNNRENTTTTITISTTNTNKTDVNTSPDIELTKNKDVKE